MKSLRLEATTLKGELEDLLSHVDPLTGVSSRTSLLTVLRELHATGRTIVLITHDAEVAAAAERQVHIRDGRIWEALAA